MFNCCQKPDLQILSDNDSSRDSSVSSNEELAITRTRATTATIWRKFVCSPAGLSTLSMLGTTLATLGISVLQKVTLTAAFALLTKTIGIAALGAAGSVGLLYGLPLAILLLCMLKFMASESPRLPLPANSETEQPDEESPKANNNDVDIEEETRLAKELFVPTKPTEGLQSCIQPREKKNKTIRLALTDRPKPHELQDAKPDELQGAQPDELQGTQPRELADKERADYLKRLEDEARALCLEQIAKHLSEVLPDDQPKIQQIIGMISGGCLEDLFEIQEDLLKGDRPVQDLVKLGQPAVNT